jgi:hypothetical protein
VLLNVILSCLGYQSQQPHPWGYNRRGEILAYAGYRTGEFAFALLPLTILFAGRNNILLWVTDWPYSTFILLHRWVARLFATHTILHSIFLLAARVQTGTYKSDLKLPYWKWGIVGTVFASAMLVFSLVWMRRLSYEVFLIGHIIMAIFTIVGSWYHLILRFGKTGTHEYWLYAAFAVWALDHVLRMLRILNNGFQRATITEVGPHHVRVEIPSVRFANKPACHGYVYFPTVQPLRPWENHPFSVNSTAVLHSFRAKLDAGPGSPTSSFHDADSKDNTATKTNSTVATSRIAAGETRASPGVTLYVRKSTGMTRHLQNHNSLLALLDGPYPNNPAEHVLSCERLLLIGGGIGITGLLGFMSGGHANVKLAWSVKVEAAALVADLEGVVKSVGEREVKVGERLNVNALLREEVRMGWGRVGVVVCGPGGLCDDVRAEVARLGRHEKTVFELEVDAFSW